MDAVLLGGGNRANSKDGIPVASIQQYLFFIANVVCKNRDIRPPIQLYFRAVRELLRYHQEYTAFNHYLQQLASSGGSQSSPGSGKKGHMMKADEGKEQF
jgi:hypothetical protein